MPDHLRVRNATPYLLPSESAAVSELGRIRQRLETNTIHPLQDYRLVQDALDFTADVMHRLEDELSELASHVIRLNHKRTDIFKAIGHCSMLFEMRYGREYSVARARANYNNRKKRIRLQVLTEAGGKCKMCGRTSDLTLDHIKPVRLGGGDSLGNLQALCRPCNSRKGASYHGAFPQPVTAEFFGDFI